MFKWLKRLFQKEVHVPRPVVVQPNPVQLPEPDPGGVELIHANEDGMVKLALIVGHTAHDQGADLFGAGYGEYQYNKKVAEAAKQYAEKTYGKKVQVEIIFRDGIGILGAYAKAKELLCDVCIELHFNAADSKAQGTETLCTPDVNDIDFAHIVHMAVCRVLGRQGTSRGVKVLSKSARGATNVYSFAGGANCLVEPFFGDNKDDATNGLIKYEEYAKGLVEATVLWARKNDLLF